MLKKKISPVIFVFALAILNVAVGQSSNFPNSASEVDKWLNDKTAPRSMFRPKSDFEIIAQYEKLQRLTGKATNTPKPDSIGALKRKINDILFSEKTAESTANSMRPQDSTLLFTKMFGSETMAKELSMELEPFLNEFGAGLKSVLRRKHGMGNTVLSVEKFTDPDSLMVNQYQRKALLKMEKRMPLYSIRMTKPGEEHGFHLWNFVFVDGRFQYVGKMTELIDTTGKDTKLKAIYELRVKDAREILGISSDSN